MTPYNPLKKFKRKELREELDFMIAEQLNGVIRGDIDSEQARSTFFAQLKARFRKRAELKHRVRKRWTDLMEGGLLGR